MRDALNACETARGESQRVRDEFEQKEKEVQQEAAARTAGLSTLLRQTRDRLADTERALQQSEVGKEAERVEAARLGETLKEGEAALAASQSNGRRLATALAESNTELKQIRQVLDKVPQPSLA